MSDDLKEIYEQEGKLKYYFDKTVPVNLYRGQSPKEKKQGLPPIYPNPGFQTTDKRSGQIKVRLPDVESFDKVVAGEEKSNNPKTEAWVRGCRSTSGDHRGISTFDRTNPNLGGFKWFELPAGTDIPAALAITQDSDLRNRANHYTIAPKDDMPYALFLVWLEPLNKALKAV